MTVIWLAVLLVAGAAIIYAVTTGEGDEGFLVGGNGRPLVWDRSDLPLGCIYEEDVEPHLPAIRAARNQIVQRVGPIMDVCQRWQVTELFPKKPVRGAVLLRLGEAHEPLEDGVFVTSPWDPKHGGSTRLFTDKITGKLYGAIIYVDPSLLRSLQQKVWLHEFLHAFGLGHDRLTGSVMYHAVSERPSELSSRDVKRLEKEYVR